MRLWVANCITGGVLALTVLNRVCAQPRSIPYTLRELSSIYSMTLGYSRGVTDLEGQIPQYVRLRS
jgi:hypothetical protein